MYRDAMYTTSPILARRDATFDDDGAKRRGGVG